MHFFVRNFYKKCDVILRPKFQKSSNYEQQQSQLPFTMHKLSQDPSKRAQIVNFEQEEFTPKITIQFEEALKQLLYRNQRFAYTYFLTSLKIRDENYSTPNIFN